MKAHLCSLTHSHLFFYLFAYITEHPVVQGRASFHLCRRAHRIVAAGPPPALWDTDRDGPSGGQLPRPRWPYQQLAPGTYCLSLWIRLGRQNAVSLLCFAAFFFKVVLRRLTFLCSVLLSVKGLSLTFLFLSRLVCFFFCPALFDLPPSLYVFFVTNTFLCPLLFLHQVLLLAWPGHRGGAHRKSRCFPLLPQPSGTPGTY